MFKVDLFKSESIEDMNTRHASGSYV